MQELEATTASQITQFVQKNGGVALVDCYATWCGPCQQIAPYVHEKCKERGMPLIKVNVDEAPELFQLYKIQVLPTFLAIKDEAHNVVARKEGGSEDLVSWVIHSAIAER